MSRPRCNNFVAIGYDSRAYGVLGMVVRLFGERLAVGVHALLPIGELTKLRAFYSDEREQYFSNSLHPELYADRTTTISLAFAAGVRITDALSLGVGGTLSLGARVGAQAYVSDAGNLGKLLLDSDVPVNISLSPHVGASYVIKRRLRLSATAHAAKRSELDTDFTFLLATGSQQAANVTLVHDYVPWLIGFGGSYEFVQASDLTLSVTIAAVYGMWSDYVDRHNQRPSDAYAWADTITPTLGVRARSGGWATFVDVTYQPTPVPAQTGRTNYVDNDRMGGSLGVEYQRAVWGNTLHIGAQLSAHRLLARHQNKLLTPTWPDGVDRAPDHVKDEVPDDAQINGQPLLSNSAGCSGRASI
jgi:long-chain fatty acid transport protein